MLPVTHRLRSSSDYRAVSRGRSVRRASGPLLVVQARPGGGEERPPRVGFVVTRSLGHAVARNRTKRRLRALVAGRLAGIPAGTDLVVRANPDAAAATSAVLGAELDALLRRALAGRASPRGRSLTTRQGGR